MLLRKFPARFCVWLILIFLSALVLCPAAEKKSSKGEKGSASKVPAEDIFAKAGFFRIRIEVSKEGMNKLRRHSWGWGESQKERPSVLATVYEGDKVYTNVALHLKGAAGSFRPVDDRPAFTLSFDKVAKGQDFHGLDKLSLNNSVQDPSFLAEKICREIFIAAGVPTPRATHARVEFNGRDLGVYVLVEGWGRRFLKRYFQNTRGNLYDGGFVKEITDNLDVNSGDHPKDHSDLQRLVDAAQELDRGKRLERLEQVLDTDRFLTMIALEVMMAHWDGYAMNKNNYRLFHDLDRDKMVFMPHGLDQMFGVMRTEPNLPILPHFEGLVARALIQTPEGRRRYMRKMSQLLTNVFNAATITNRVRTIAEHLRPAFAERSQPSALHFDREVASLCSRIALRAQSLEQQLSLPSNTLSFDSSGIARLTNWKSKSDWGNPAFEEIKNGKPVLHINLSSGSGVGSWCTRVLLESGHYRLEGRAKTHLVTPDPGDVRAGAGLRIQGRPRFAQKLLGTSDWTDLAFEFEIAEPVRDTELRCELRAGKGEVWFDTESLRLVRK